MWKLSATVALVVGACVVGSLASQPFPPPPAKVVLSLKELAARELESLQGTYDLVAFADGGGTFRRGNDPTSTFKVEGDRFTSVWSKDEGGQQVEQGRIQIVAADGPTKVLDMIHEQGPYRGQMYRVLYRTEGRLLMYTTVTWPQSIAEDPKVSTGSMAFVRR